MKSAPYRLFTLILLFSACGSPKPSSFDTLGLQEITVDDLQKGYETGRYSAVEVVEAYLERIAAYDTGEHGFNAMRAINHEALAQAARLDEERRAGTIRGPLHGVPVVLKDNINTSDMPTTAGSRFMEHSVPPDDAFIVKKLREQGAIILGKTNLSEWANFHSSFSSSGWSGLGGQVHSAFDITRNPCGSSSGSGVAASVNFATLAIGTETNGSIVCPSGANGIVGLKPTVGLWSRSGIIPISYTTDSAGPMVRTVRDAAILLGALTGVDPADGLSGHSEAYIHPDYTVFLNENGLQGKRVGFFKAPLGNHYRVDTLMHHTIRLIESLGATVVEIDRISEVNVGGDAFQVLLYEFKDGLDAYFGELGEDAPVKSMADLAALTRADSLETSVFDRNLIFMAAEKGDLNEAAYQQARARMLRHSREEGIDKVMDLHQLDVLVAPTGSPAWKTDEIMGDNFKIASSSPSARAGYPIISLPMGYIDHLPVGISFFGRAWSEPVLLETAYAFEQATKHRKAPF